MTIDWKKLAIWVCVVVAVAIAADLYFAPPYTEPPVVTVPAPVPVPPAPTPVPPVVEPPVPHPVPPEVLAPPKLDLPLPPKPKLKVKPRFVPRTPNPDTRCYLVPHEAYEHPVDVVMTVARRRGITGEALDILKWCITTAQPVR